VRGRIILPARRARATHFPADLAADDQLPAVIALIGVSTLTVGAAVVVTLIAAVIARNSKVLVASFPVSVAAVGANFAIAHLPLATPVYLLISVPVTVSVTISTSVVSIFIIAATSHLAGFMRLAHNNSSSGRRLVVLRLLTIALDLAATTVIVIIPIAIPISVTITTIPVPITITITVIIAPLFNPLLNTDIAIAMPIIPTLDAFLGADFLDAISTIAVTITAPIRATIPVPISIIAPASVPISVTIIPPIRLAALDLLRLFMRDEAATIIVRITMLDYPPLHNLAIITIPIPITMISSTTKIIPITIPIAIPRIATLNNPLLYHRHRPPVPIPVPIPPRLKSTPRPLPAIPLNPRLLHLQQATTSPSTNTNIECRAVP
jgi:hypothetical protein